MKISAKVLENMSDVAVVTAALDDCKNRHAPQSAIALRLLLIIRKLRTGANFDDNGKLVGGQV